MGCAQSKIDNEESVARCKERRNLMKEAVVARNAFAAAHSAYSVSLKNTGAALSDYGHDEAQATAFVEGDDKEDPQPLDSTAATPLRPPSPPLDSLLPPPPPLPEFSPSPVKRSVSLPSNVMKVRKNRLNVENVTIVEDDEEEEEDVEELEPRGKMSKEVKKNGEKGVGVGGGGGGGGEMEAATENLNLNLSPRTPEARPMQNNMAWDYFFNVEHHQHYQLGGTSLAIEEEEKEEEEETKNINNVEQQETVTVNSDNVNVNQNNDDVAKNSNVTVDEPKKVVVEEVEEPKSAPPIYTRRSSATTSSANLMQILNKIDDHFLKASQTAQEVSNLLETTRMHYHSNFADNRGKTLSI